MSVKGIRKVTVHGKQKIKECASNGVLEALMQKG
jgi:hypothetical protein